MKEIVIKIPDEVYERLFTMKPMDLADQITIDMAIKHGKVLPKGHTELIDTKKLIQSIARSADNMKDNGVAPVFDLHEITNLILAQDVLIEADKGEPE